MRLARSMLWMLLVLAGPSSAWAQSTAGLMPRVGGDEAVPPAMRDAARAAATSVLREEGLLVIEALQLEAQLDEAERQCLPSSPCVPNVFRHAGVDVLVGLVLNGDAEGVQRVWVVTVRADGSREAVQPVEGELSDAVADALRPLLDAPDPNPAGPFLQIEGTAGAHITVDGEPAGDIPLTQPGEPGAHEVEARLDGHAPRRVRVRLPDDPSRTVTVDLQLTPEQSHVHWGLVVGSVAIAAGIGAAVLPPAISFVSAGCTDMGCTEFEEVDDIVWVWTAVGGVAAAAGVALLIWAASDDDTSVSARLLPTGAQLEGRF